MDTKRIAALIKLCPIFLIVFSTSLITSVNAQISEIHLAVAEDNALNKLNVVGKITGFGEIKSGDVGLYQKIAFVINILLGLAGIIATIYVIVAGTRWIMAGGNEEQITKAKDTIKSAVIGISVVLASYIVVNYVIGELIAIFTT